MFKTVLNFLAICVIGCSSVQASSLEDQHPLEMLESPDGVNIVAQQLYQKYQFVDTSEVPESHFLKVIASALQGLKPLECNEMLNIFDIVVPYPFERSDGRDKKTLVSHMQLGLFRDLGSFPPNIRIARVRSLQNLLKTYALPGDDILEFAVFAISLPVEERATFLKQFNQELENLDQAYKGRFSLSLLFGYYMMLPPSLRELGASKGLVKKTFDELTRGIVTEYDQGSISFDLAIFLKHCFAVKADYESELKAWFLKLLNQTEFTPLCENIAYLTFYLAPELGWESIDPLVLRAVSRMGELLEADSWRYEAEQYARYNLLLDRRSDKGAFHEPDSLKVTREGRQLKFNVAYIDQRPLIDHLQFPVYAQGQFGTLVFLFEQMSDRIKAMPFGEDMIAKILCDVTLKTMNSGSLLDSLGMMVFRDEFFRDKLSGIKPTDWSTADLNTAQLSAIISFLYDLDVQEKQKPRHALSPGEEMLLQFLLGSIECQYGKKINLEIFYNREVKSKPAYALGVCAAQTQEKKKFQDFVHHQLHAYIRSLFVYIGSQQAYLEQFITPSLQAFLTDRYLLRHQTPHQVAYLENALGLRVGLGNNLVWDENIGLVQEQLLLTPLSHQLTSFFSFVDVSTLIQQLTQQINNQLQQHIFGIADWLQLTSEESLDDYLADDEVGSLNERGIVRILLKMGILIEGEDA